MPTSSETNGKRKPAPLPATGFRWQPWVLWGGVSVGALIIILAGVGAYAYTTAGTTIVRGVTVASVDVGQKTSLDATHLLDQRWAEFSATAYVFQVGDKKFTIHATADSGSDTEVVLGLVDFDSVAAVNSALSFGRRGNWWQQLRERTSGWLGRQHEMGTVEINQAGLHDTLTTTFHDLEQPAVNASLKIDAAGDATVVSGKTGMTIDYTTGIQAAVQQARHLKAAPIILQINTDEPDVAVTDALNNIAKRDVGPLLDRAPLTLSYAQTTWPLKRDQLRTMLGFTGTTAEPRLGFNVTAATTFLNGVAKDVNIPAKNSRFEVVDGKVQAFQVSQIGITLNVDSTIAGMQQDLIDSGLSESAIRVNKEVPLSDTVGTNDLGISEMVAEATTNFKGSPTNRRFNLTFGAKLLNGLLIQPGEEFSLVKSLGKIDATHGWKPELVIKGTAITPEFGGGLCQVATTMFRSALNAGLPITERHNHSLRIRYYEPPVGLDATIYDPQPDLRFKNDYTTPLLLQTNVVGDNITFQLYGTKDGRIVDIPEPKVYNKTAIPATTNIEVDDLKPGQQECQKPGHPGADATATYIVTKSDGTKVTQTFQSHYRALGVICRVGKKAATPATTTNTNTSTPAVNTNTTVPVDTTNTNASTNTNS